MRRKILIIVSALLAVALLSGCTGSVAWPGLSASDTVAYVTHSNAVFAVDVKTGAELGKFSGEGGGLSSIGNPSIFISTPVLTNDGLVIVSDSGNKHVMYAIDPTKVDPQNKTMQVAWRFSKVDGHWVAPPLIVGDFLFAPNADGKIYVLDLKDGQSDKQAIKVIEPFKASNKAGRLWAQPVADGSRLFATSLDGSVFAVDLNTYDIIWHKDLGGAVPGGAVIGSDGMLYVGSFAKQLEKFDPATGEHQAVLNVSGWIWGTPIADGDNLYFGDVDGNFYSYNVKEAKLNWAPIKPDGAITSSPLVLGDHILITTESGNLYSINKADGSFKLWYQLPDKKKGKAYTTPVLAGGYVLVAYTDSDYYLVALDATNPNPNAAQWTFSGK